MSILRLSEARVVLFESQVNSRRLLKDALHMIGFRRIEMVARLEELESAVAAGEPDLLLIDIDEDAEDACRIIQDIRNRKLSANPFVTVIAMTWSPNPDTVTRALNAGTDDMVAKPVSGKVLRERVVNLIENRKDFVVTADYIGPDRRTGDRQPSENDLPTVPVPNTLRHATKRDASGTVDPAAIADTVRSLCVQKIHRLAQRIVLLAEDLIAHVGDCPGERLPHGTLVRSADMLSQIEAIIGEQDFQSIRMIAASTRKIVSGLDAAKADADVRQIELLRLHAQAIAVTLKESDESAGALVEALSEAALVVNG